MKITATSAAITIVLALTSVASAAHTRHHMNIDTYRHYQALSPYGEPIRPFETRPSTGPSDSSNQTLTGGPSGGLGS